jgi:orotidine-5'-phosphate decarboxylase
MRPQDRLIVALDVPSVDEAMRLVDELGDLVYFYKVGLELLMTGGFEPLLRELVKGKKVFVDLKLPNDIPETIRRAVSVAASIGVTFLTLSASATPETLVSAVDGRGTSSSPKLLVVPFLSSQSREEYTRLRGLDASQFEEALRLETRAAVGYKMDGFIVSGPEIALLRGWYPDAVLVSPGIRLAGSKTDDHKRSCTPAEAIELGADHIVVGRPIRNATDRRAAAKRILDEIAGAVPPERKDPGRDPRRGTNGGGGQYSASGVSDSAPVAMFARSKH